MMRLTSSWLGPPPEASDVSVLLFGFANGCDLEKERADLVGGVEPAPVQRDRYVVRGGWRQVAESLTQLGASDRGRDPAAHHDDRIRDQS
jgi:hypothetical protein